MDRILETLRSSTDNDVRKASSAKLRQIQETHPEEFLNYTFQCVSSEQCPQDMRFFAATVVLAFVEESWHSALSAELQRRYIQLYIDFALSHLLPSQLLSRKVATIIAVMARRGAAKASAPGQLPPLMEAVAAAYTQCLHQRCLLNDTLTQEGEVFLPQLLLLLHIFLKEAQTKRIGAAFEILCAGMVPALSVVFTALASYSPLAQYDAYLFLFKAALRVFGVGVFEAEFYQFLLSATWQLADGLQSSEDFSTHEKRCRLIDYGIKIQERMVNYFPTHLHLLGTSFFFCSDGAACGSGRSLFALLDAVIATATPTNAQGASCRRAHSGDQETSNALLPEKTVCRAMRVITFFATGEEGDEFIAQCLGALANSPDVLPRLLRNTVLGFLPDFTDPESRDEWRSNPEKVADDLDIDFDDNSPVSCAEQLFVGLTGSTAAANRALPESWALVNQLLSTGSEVAVTAALHAIGIGYNTMSAGASRESYLSFLQCRLLPIVTDACQSGGANAASSVFVLRRVVWLIGMWCESVQEPATRREVHAALEELLESYANDVVILLTTLRTTENFFTDDAFSLAELTPRSVPVVLAAVRRVLQHLRAPTTVRQIACLVSSMVNKGAVSAEGDEMLSVFAAATAEFATRCADSTAGGANPAVSSDGEAWGSDDDEDSGHVNMGVLSQLLETLTAIVTVTTKDASAWQLVYPVVTACTLPGRSITPWAEDAAWELLLSVSRSTTFSRPSSDSEMTAMCNVALDAFQWCHANSLRDFEALHLAVRSASALMLLLNESSAATTATHSLLSIRMESTTLLHVQDVGRYVQMLVGTEVGELSSACFALLLATVRFDTTVSGATVAQRCAEHLLAAQDVQSEMFAVPLAALLALSIRCDASGELLTTFLAEFGVTPQFVVLLENLVLVLDVCPNKLTEKCICWLLGKFQAACASSLAPDVNGMLSIAIGSAFGTAPDESSNAEDAQEDRPTEELLLEMVGDEGVSACQPHLHRLLQAYGPLTQF